MQINKNSQKLWWVLWRKLPQRILGHSFLLLIPALWGTPLSNNSKMVETTQASTDGWNEKRPIRTMKQDSAFKREEFLDFPSGPVIKTPSTTARVTGSIPSQGTKIHAPCSPQKKGGDFWHMLHRGEPWGHQAKLISQSRKDKLLGFHSDEAPRGAKLLETVGWWLPGAGGRGWKVSVQRMWSFSLRKRESLGDGGGDGCTAKRMQLATPNYKLQNG